MLKARVDTILVLDGLFVHVPQLCHLLDFTVFIPADYDECITRAKRRNQEQQADTDAIEQLYCERYHPGFQKYMDEIQPRN